MTWEVIAFGHQREDDDSMTESIATTHIWSDAALAPSAEESHCAARLRVVLRLNACNSVVFGGLLAAIPTAIDRLLDTGHPGWIRLVGLALLPFAAFCAWLSTTPLVTLRTLTPAVIAGDAAWVIASAITSVVGWYSGGGVVAVLAMAVVVDLFAFLQWTGWRRLRSTR